MNLEHLPIGKNPPHEVNVVVEVPVGGEPIKYEIHKPSGALMVDRFLYTAMRYRATTASSRTRCPMTATPATWSSPTSAG
jgi:inorganic pyrophosphatase